MHVSFLDRDVAVDSPHEFHIGLPKMPNEFAVFSRGFASRPGARAFAGDVWKTQLISTMETQQTRWFADGAFVANGKLQATSTKLVEEMQSLAGNREAPWAAVHLRLEDDRFTHGKAAAKAGGDTLDKIKAQLAAHNGANDAVPAFYASGPLTAKAKARLPENWRNKNDYFDAANWAGMWRGTWFDGRAYDITNATGSLVDMFVLLEAPLTIMAEFSSFGEYVAALRCPLNRATIMYDVKGSFFKPNCSHALLFQREWHTQYRAHRCGSDDADVQACGSLMSQHFQFKRNIAWLDTTLQSSVKH